MSTSEEDTVIRARAGSGLDLAHRMDRIEGKYEDLAKEVSSLKETVGRVELNQTHAADLNRLRFDALETGIKALGGQLTDFMRRIDGIISGEIQTQGTRQGAELVADYQKWRASVDAFVDEQTIRNAREQGVFATFGAQKAFLLALVAVASPLIAVITLVWK